MIYLCAGMYRSGSTWLYNAVRGILKHAGAPDLAAGWITDKEELLKHRNVIIKLHSFDAGLAARADVVLVSHRDLRDVAASLQRKFQNGFSIKMMHETFDDYARWSQLAAYDLRYERLLTDKVSELKKIAAALKLPAPALRELPYETICREVDAEKFTAQRSTAEGHDAINLLHDGHVTNGRHGSWKNFVPDELITAIENEFRAWMSAEGYLVSEQPPAPAPGAARRPAKKPAAGITGRLTRLLFRKPG
jgi:hypothetical protein